MALNARQGGAVACLQVMRTVRIMTPGSKSAGILLMTGLLTLSACGAGADSPSAEAPGVVRVAAGLYPLAEVVRQVGGDLVQVDDLTPPGAEPHDLELSPPEIETVDQADLLVVLGGGFQPALESLAGRNTSLVVAERIAKGSGPPGDPHFWLDPMTVGEVAGLVADELARLDEANEGAYRANTKAFAIELASLHEEMEVGLRDCSTKTLVTAHDSFGWLASRYGLRAESIAGLSPDQEPDPARLAELTDLVKEEKVTTVFTETLVSARVAETLARETGVTTAVLDPLESAPADGGYLEAMRSNLRVLREGLGCR